MVEVPEELRMLQLALRRFVRNELMPFERRTLAGEPIEKEEEDRLQAGLRELGTWWVSMPKELGGPGFGLLGTVVISEELSKVLVSGNLYSAGPPPLLVSGSPEQQKRWLWPGLEGEKTWCFALTESGTHSMRFHRRTSCSSVPSGSSICVSSANSSGSGMGSERMALSPLPNTFFCMDHLLGELDVALSPRGLEIV